MTAITVLGEYNAKNVALTVEQVSAVWQTPAADVPGYSAEDLLKTVKGYLEGWFNGGKPAGFDYRLQALLALLLACEKTWFASDRRDDISAWLRVLRDTNTGASWTEAFKNKEDAITAAIQEGLQTSQSVSVEIEDSTVTIQYTQGDYGTGPHDGSVVISDNALTILNASTPGVETVYSGELPANPQDLLAALQDVNWVEA